MQRNAIVLMGCAAALWLAGACSDDDDGDGTGGTGGAGTGTTTTGQGGVQGGSGPGGGGATGGPCAANACMDTEPDAACEACVAAECATEMSECMADTGDGGGAACIGCGDILGDGSWDDACDSSKNIFAALLACICGDGATPGQCN